MDKKTFAQFLLFSTVVLVAWWLASYVIFKRPAQPKAAPVPREVAHLPAAEKAATEAEAARPSQGREPVQAALPAAPAKPALEPVKAILTNELIETHWTSKGAALTRLELRDERYRAPYKEGDTRPALALLRDFQEGLYSDTIETVTFFSTGAEGVAQEIDVATGDVVYELVAQTDDRLVFQTDVHDGKGHFLQVRKVVTMPSAAYHYEVALEFAALAGAPFEFSCGLRGPAGVERETLQTRFLGTRVGIFEGLDDYEIAKESPATLLKKGPQRNESADIAWAGVVNHYFIAVMEPEDRQWVGTVVSKAVTDTDIQQARGRWPPGTVQKESARLALARQNATVVINTVRRRLETSLPHAEHYRFIAAPKEDGILESYDVGLPGLVELGLLPGLSRIALATLNGIHSVLPNYGLAILVLTFIVRLILHPLTVKSQMGMTRMQKLQPQIMELQRKYASDKQKFTQEQWKLMQKYGVHPLSGCWPLLLQMPVLFALFGALRAAIELRHAGFLWMDDLARPDALFHFPIYLPVLGNEFNLLPILVVVVMLWNQKFQPKPATEQARQQQKMMKFMPVLFGFLFYQMPSGLCVYFVTSMGIGSLERWLIDKRAAKVELKPVDEEARAKKRRVPAGKEPAKSGWLQKLEKMQKKLGEQPRPPRKTTRGKGKK